MCAGLSLPPTYAKTAFSSDGKTIGVGTRDGTILLMEIGIDVQDSYQDPLVPRRRIGEPFSAHSGAVSALAFSHRNDRIASGGADGSVHVWDVATQRLLSSLQAKHATPVSRLVFSRDDKTIASVGDEGTIMVWDAATGQLLGEAINDFPASAGRFALSPDGATLALPDRKRVVLWDVKAGGVWGEPLEGHDADIEKVVFSPDGAMLATGRADGMVFLWDLARKDADVPEKPIPAVSGSVVDLEFSPDGKTLAVAGNLGTGEVSLWDIATRLNEARYMQRGFYVGVPLPLDSRELVFGIDGKKLWLIDGGHVLRFLDLVSSASRNVTHLTYIFPGWQTVFGLSPDSGVLASGSYGGTISLWDTHTGQAKGVPWVAHSGMVTSLAFDPAGKVVASADSSGEIKLWNTETLTQTGPTIPAYRVQGTSLAFSPDGARLASGSAGGEIKLWDAKSGTLVYDLGTAGTTGITGMAFDPQGRRLVSVDGEGSVMLWDVEGRHELDRQVMESSSGDSLVAFRRDGKVVTANSNSIQLWNTANSKLASEAVVRHGQEWQADKTTGLTLSPDGKLAALTLSLSGTGASSTAVWDLQEGRLLRPPLLSTGKPAVAATFTDDGKKLLVVYADGTSSTQELTQELDWSGVICDLANQNMEWTEWEKNLGSGEPYRRICPKAPLPQSVIEAAGKSSQALSGQGPR